MRQIRVQYHQEACCKVGAAWQACAGHQRNAGTFRFVQKCAQQVNPAHQKLVKIIRKTFRYSGDVFVHPGE